MAGRVQPDEAHLPRLCDDWGPFIERQLGDGKNRSSGNILGGPDFDVLRTHQPDHVLFRPRGPMRQPVFWILDGWGICCRAYRGRFRIAALTLFALAVPVLMEMGKEPIRGAADDDLLSEAAARNTGSLWRPAG
ncbi:MAG: hypothetical protein CM15mP21_5160 [Hyphomicrobiales bacterium]|nr:MAG: hypothetical protein CM15mP21_5160 [Hyphomicrobiales bacterium]